MQKPMFYNLVQMDDKAKGMREMEQGNRKRFNELLNTRRHPRAVYHALLALTEPSVQQADDVFKERQVSVRKVLPLAGEAEGVQQAI